MTRVSKAEFARIKAAARRARREAKKADTEALMDALGASVESDGTPRIPPPPKRKPKRKKSPSLSRLKKALWAEISLLVRSWSPMCVACGRNTTEVAAHIVPSHEGAATRFFLPNLYPACVPCNGAEKWNRGSWVKKHEAIFGEDYVNALYDFSKTTFQLKKHWVIAETERIRKLRERQN